MVPARLAGWMQPFSAGFTAPIWQRVLVLIVGTILSPGRRTIEAALRVTGLDQDPHFTNYHRVLNRNRWCSRWLARHLLRLLVAAFVPDGPVIIGLDDTLERRWGARMSIGTRTGPRIGVQKGPPFGVPGRARVGRRGAVGAAAGNPGASAPSVGDQARFLNRQLSLPVSTMSQ